MSDSCRPLFLLFAFHTKTKTNSEKPIANTTPNDSSQAFLPGCCRVDIVELEFRTGGHKCLACLVALILHKVLDEACGEIFGFLIPDAGICIGVAWVEDIRIYAGKRCGHLEIEVRYHLRRGCVDAAVEDSIDDATGILDGDTFACAVPTCVDEVCLGAIGFHSLHQFLSILGWMELKECLAKASREGWSWLSDAALCTSKLSGEARD